jgi:hypothetical protein
VVNITPDGGIFGIFRNLNYKPWYALGEFVDNAISAWEKWEKTAEGIPRPKKVRVEIEIGASGAEPYIEIRDDATGIAYKYFDNAFKVAKVPEDTTSLNEFGMGMKTAAFWFSNNWTVRTSFIGEPKIRTMRFDLKRILSSSENSLEIKPEESLTKPETHFTTVRLVNLNQIPKGKTVGKIKEHLTDIYRVFMAEGSLDLIFNGELLKYSPPALMNEPKVDDPEGDRIEWRRDFDFTIPSTGHRVHGWVGLRIPGSTSLAGFALFRKKRLIVGSNDETYRPSEIFKNSNSFTWQRLIGDVHLDHRIKVSHTKDGFLWDDGEEEEFIAGILGVLKQPEMDFLRQAENFRTRGEKFDEKKVEKALVSIKSTLQHSIPESIEVISPVLEDIKSQIPESLPKDVGTITDSKEIELKVDTMNHGLWLVRLTVVQNEAVSNFFTLGSKREVAGGSGRALTHIDVKVNLAHPFVERYLGANQENAELVLAFAASLSIALSLGKSVGANSNYIIDYLNDVLRFGGAQ